MDTKTISEQNIHPDRDAILQHKIKAVIVLSDLLFLSQKYNFKSLKKFYIENDYQIINIIYNKQNDNFREFILHVARIIKMFESVTIYYFSSSNSISPNTMFTNLTNVTDVNNVNFISIEQIKKKDYMEREFTYVDHKIKAPYINVQHHDNLILMRCISSILNAFKQNNKQTFITDLYDAIGNIAFCQYMNDREQPMVK